MQLHGLPVNAHVRQAAARRENGLTDVEGGGNADRLDRDVHTRPTRESHHLIDSGSIGAVDQPRRPELFSHSQPVVVKVDHQNRCG